jgi:hypothetical protein
MLTKCVFFYHLWPASKLIKHRIKSSCRILKCNLTLWNPLFFTSYINWFQDSYRGAFIHLFLVYLAMLWRAVFT